MNLEIFFHILVPCFFSAYLQICGAQNNDVVTLYKEFSQQVWTRRTIFNTNLSIKAARNVTISRCTNLPYWWTEAVSSINTRNNCASLFDEPDCTGNFIEVSPTSPSHGRLDHWQFDDMTVSVGPCRHQCDPEVTSSSPDKPVEIEIYEETHFGGRNKSIVVNGCTTIPTQLWNQTFSIKAQGHCVQLYNNSGCSSESGENVELRRGTPFHNDLWKWGMTQPKSISRCDYKCSDEMLSTQKPARGDVILFASTYLQGKSTNIKINGTKCHAIINRPTTKSIQIGNNTCITIFDMRGCQGRSVNLTKSLWDLPRGKSDFSVRSLQSCDNYDKIVTNDGSANNPTTTISTESIAVSEMTTIITVTHITESDDMTTTNVAEVIPKSNTATDLPEAMTSFPLLDAVDVIYFSTTTAATTSLSEVISPVSSHTRNKESGGIGMSALVVVFVLILVITGLIIFVKCYPCIRHNVTRLVGTLRSRLIYRNADTQHSGQFHWKRMLLINEQETG